MLSRINWKDPRSDPIFRQFVPLWSWMMPDHPELTLDSLHEEADSPVPGLVHRYPDKVLFLGKPLWVFLWGFPLPKWCRIGGRSRLTRSGVVYKAGPERSETGGSGERRERAREKNHLGSVVDKEADLATTATSICPTYCTFCTRSYAVGADTESVTKSSQRPAQKRWDKMMDYLASKPGVHDVVVSGGDSYYLMPWQLRQIGERLLGLPNIKRIRFASKGMAVAPSRFVDGEDDWASTLIDVSSAARRAGKSVALHTHFNHPNEVSWITSRASQRLLEAGVTVRNQTVLLRGVNDDVETMAALIRKLADNNITPVS